MKTSGQNEQTPYAAFLRGINVGGHQPIKMEELKKAFVSLGLKNVKTLLASGNVVFEASRESTAVLTKKIGEKLEKTFGSDIGVFIRTKRQLQRLADTTPFKGIAVTPQTRLYVTFLSEKPKSSLKIPYESSEGNFKIIRVTGSEVCSALTLSPDGPTTELMGVLEREFGRKVTTRNWNTITRILETGK